MEQTLLSAITILNLVIGIIFTLLYFHQFVYIFISLIKKPKKYPPTDQTKRYAVLIAARNEACCIGHLLESIQRQTYPADKITVYVGADNCTDQTAEIARANGAVVYERFDTERIGKGYVLDYLLQNIKAETGDIAYYDGYFVFDADNILKLDYIEQMDRCFCAGNRVVTSYRNSKNYAQNWITAGQGLWFIHEAIGLNNVRGIIGSSAAISGTGFLAAGDIFAKTDGWKCNLLVEDIEFTTQQVLDGEKIGYCHDAMFYDEQPATFKQSWRQRLRWSKGFLQVFRDYYPNLIRSIFRGSYSSYDMFTAMAPAFILTLVTLLANTVLIGITIASTGHVTLGMFVPILYFFAYTYCLFLFFGIVTLIGEWKNILCSAPKKILYLFLFPVHMFVLLPCSLVAMVSKVTWKPIDHNYNVGIDDMIASAEPTDEPNS